MAAESLETTLAAFDENADYDADASVAKAKLFRTACRRLIPKLPSQASRGGSGGNQSFGFRLDEIRGMLQEVEAWLALNDTDSAAVIHPDFTFARGD
ncbi:MAG: hypothetical protein HQ581_09965 [Planctomycetes bacterium]|nr:hypothetical protein [Planctomycetota bacterium]